MAYSVDLRARVVEAYLSGRGSMVQIASLFQVAVSTLLAWVNRARRSETLVPGHGGGARRLVGAELEHTVRILVANNSDATLDELRGLLARDSGVRVSRTTMFRVLGRMGITHKKNGTRSGKRPPRRGAEATRIPAGPLVAPRAGTDLCRRKRNQSGDDQPIRLVGERHARRRGDAKKLGG
jgi:transposase